MCSTIRISWLVVQLALCLQLALTAEQLRETLSQALNAITPRDVETVPDGMRKVRMLLYNGNDTPLNFTLEQSRDMMNRVDRKKPFVLYIHGYLEAPGNESISTIINAYQQRRADNLVVLDWSAYAFGSYVGVVLNVKDVSAWTARALQSMVSAGLSVDSIHVVGHSLGAHVGGFLGRNLNFTLPRVTALDPANPLFYQLNADHIDATSARLVDVIHTDGGGYGAYPRTGTVDFYANGGVRPQPGCHLLGIPLTPRALCSHWRSWRYYAESVVNNTAFPALECDSFSSFSTNGCRNNRVIYFGYSMPRNATGVYYFNTNNQSPFGRGMKGIRSN